MQIHLRQSGQKTPAVIIRDVLYFEPLPEQVQYTVKGGDQTESIDIDEKGDFLYGEGAYGFCEVFAQEVEPSHAPDESTHHAELLELAEMVAAGNTEIDALEALAKRILGPQPALLPAGSRQRRGMDLRHLQHRGRTRNQANR